MPVRASAEVPPPAVLRLLAKEEQSVVLVRGDHRIALSTAKDWVTFPSGVVKHDAKTAAALLEASLQLPGNVAWAASPLVFTDHELLRIGESVATKLPGERQHHVAHGELELWRYKDWAALGRRGKAIAPVEQLPANPTYDKSRRS